MHYSLFFRLITINLRPLISPPCAVQQYTHDAVVGGQEQHCSSFCEQNEEIITASDRCQVRANRLRNDSGNRRAVLTRKRRRVSAPEPRARTTHQQQQQQQQHLPATSRPSRRRLFTARSVPPPATASSRGVCVCVEFFSNFLLPRFDYAKLQMLGKFLLRLLFRSHRKTLHHITSNV